MTPYKDMTTQQTSSKKISYLGLACIATVVGALLLPAAGNHSWNRASLLWLVICILNGMILSNVKSTTLFRDFLYSFIVSSILWISFFTLYIVQWLVERILNIESQEVLVNFYGKQVDMSTPESWPYAIILFLIWHIVTTIFIFIVNVSGQGLAEISKYLYSFGPEGLERVRQIILTMAGVVASVIALWATFF